MMSDSTQPVEAPANPAADLFYESALDRIRRYMLAIGSAATVAALPIFGWKVAVGVVFGCIVAWANFLWLKQAIGALSDKVTHSGRPQSSASTVAKFLLRYGLIAIGAYVIFLSSRESLYGFLGGLFLAVAAILCE